MRADWRRLFPTVGFEWTDGSETIDNTPNQMLGSESNQFSEGDDELRIDGEPRLTEPSDEPETNRPAANANLSDSVGATTEEFEFQDEADDFLGLEGDVSALEEAAGDVDGDFDTEEEEELGLSEGWLLEVPLSVNTEEAAPEHEPGSVDPGEAAAIADAVTSELANTDFDELHDDVGLDGEDYDGEYEEDSEEELADAKPSRSKLLIGVGFFVGILGTVGLLLMESGASDEGSSTEVATNTTSAVVPTETMTEAEPTDSDTAIEVPAEDGALVETVSTNSSEPIENVLEGLMSAPVEETTSVPIEPISFDPVPDQPINVDPIALTTGIAGLPEITPADLDLPVTPEAPQTVIALIEEGMASGDVAGFMELQTTAGTGFIWTGSEVPTASINQAGRVLTPAVGVVRAMMISGELFEGKLYAVGNQRIWIEIGPGRVGLDNSKISTINRIALETSDGTVTEPELGQRVRVRAPGGVLYGRIKSRVGTSVTIVTDKGARITLENPEIEPIGRLSGLVLN